MPKKKKNISSTANSEPSSSSAVSLPHLVYKINFIENTVAEKSIWTSSNDDDILKNIFESAIDASSDKNKVAEDSKVVVVLELPVGGSVSQFSIGETDDTLEVTILKHSLMLNPKALLFLESKLGFLITTMTDLIQLEVGFD